MRTVDFKYNGAVVTVREEIGEDTLTQFAIYNLIVAHLQQQTGKPLSKIQSYKASGYEKILTRTVKVEGHLPFTLPTVDDSDADIVAGFEPVMQAPKEFMKAWEAAFEKVEETPLEIQTKGMEPPLEEAPAGDARPDGGADSSERKSPGTEG